MPNVYDANKPKREMVKIGEMIAGTVFIGCDGDYYMVSDESCYDNDNYIKCMKLKNGVLHDILRTDKREVFKGNLIMECCGKE